MKKDEAHHTSVKPIDSGFFSYLASSFLAHSLIFEISKKFLRDITSQTILGYWWIVIRCILPVILIGFIVHKLGILTEISMPYPLFLLSGIIIWSGISQYLLYGVRVFIKLRSLFNSYRINRLVGILAILFIPLTITGISGILFGITIAYYNITDSFVFSVNLSRLAWALSILVLSYMVAVGLICILSIFSIFTRDIRLSMPMFRQLLFLMTPITYPISLLNDTIGNMILILNPFAIHVEILRWAFLNTALPSVYLILWNIITSLMIFLSGSYFIYRSELPLRDLLHKQ